MCVYVCVLRLWKILCGLFISLLTLFPPPLLLHFRSAFFLSSRAAPRTPAPHQHTHTHTLTITQGVWEDSKFGFRSQMRFCTCRGWVFTRKEKPSWFSAHSLEKNQITSMPLRLILPGTLSERLRSCYITHLGDLDEFSGQVSEQIMHANVHTPCLSTAHWNTFPTETAKVSNWALNSLEERRALQIQSGRWVCDDQRFHPLD